MSQYIIRVGKKEIVANTGTPPPHSGSSSSRLFVCFEVNSCERVCKRVQELEGKAVNKCRFEAFPYNLVRQRLLLYSTVDFGPDLLTLEQAHMCEANAPQTNKQYELKICFSRF